MERRHVVFEGRVQGVGFRYTAQQVASRYAVTGYVRNEPNGTVELVAEGAAAELDRFLADLRERMAQYIRHERLGSLAASGEYDAFEIRG